MTESGLFVDLSVVLEATPSEDVPVELEFFDHQAGAAHMQEIFGITVDRLPNGLGWAGERLRLITHAGTHMDAPYHYGPWSGQHGEPARTIDEIRVEECVGDAYVIDVRDLSAAHVLKLPDFLERIRYVRGDPLPKDIVLFWTGCDVLWGEEKYKNEGPAIGADVVEYCVRCGVRVMGIDAWGFDGGFAAMKRRFLSTGDSASIWPAHFAGRSFPYLQLEKLCNLDKIANKRARVFCPPIKIRNAGAGWSRVFAEIIEDQKG